MSNKVSNFIGYLKNHKVFDGPSIFSNTANITPTNLIAVRDNDVITVSERKVKYSVIDTKKQISNEVHILLEVDFTITNLLLNDSGTLLAVIGEYDVVYCFLPTSGTVPNRKDSKPKSYEGIVNNGKIEIDFSNGGNNVNVNVPADDSSNSGSTDTSTPSAFSSSSPNSPDTPSSKSIKILKVLWNPIANHDSNLVILTNDGFIRSYDIMSSNKFPDFAMDITNIYSSSNDKTFGFDDDDSIQNPISIALGSESDPIGKLTLYILTKDGDIFALCPFVPAKFLLSKDEIRQAFDNAVAAQYHSSTEESNNQEEKSHQSAVKGHYKDQLVYISDLSRQADFANKISKVSQNGTLTYYCLLDRPTNNLLKPQPQGPFRYQPFPNELYEGHAVDLITTNSNSMTIIIVLDSTGRINFYLQDVSLDMQWIGTKSVSDICLALFESITIPDGFSNKSGSVKSASQFSVPTSTVSSLKFQGPSSGSSSTIASRSSSPAISSTTTQPTSYPYHFKLIQKLSNKSTNEFEFYITSKSTVYRVDISPWAIPLIKAIEQSNNQLAAEITDNHEQTDIWVILDPATNAFPVLGLGSIVDPFGTNIQFIQTIKSLYIEIPKEYENSSTEVETTTPKKIIEIPAHSLKYSSLLQKSEVFKEFNQLIDDINYDPPKLPIGLSATEPITPDVDSLKYFSEVSNHFTTELKKLHEAGQIIYNQLNLQRAEFHRQVERLAKTSEKILEIKRNDYTKNLQDILLKQEQLRLRSLSFLEKLSRRHALLISNQEKKWFDEVQRSQKLVSGASGFERRVKNSIVQADMIIRENKVLSQKDVKNESTAKNITYANKEEDGNTPSRSIESSHTARLEVLLARESELVQNAKEHLERILSDLPSEFEKVSLDD